MSLEANGTDVFYIVNNTPVTYSYFALNVLMIVLHIGIIILNSCMIASIRRTRKVEEPGGHCLIGLSAAYIYHGLMMIYTGVYGLANMQELHECLIRFGMVNSSFMLVSWANCCLTLDRYLCIEWSFWYKKHIHIKTVWIAHGIATALAIFYGTSTLIFGWYIPKEQDGRANVCEYFNILRPEYLQIFYAITFAGFPFIMVAYVRLLWLAWKHKSAARKMHRSAPAKLAAKENKHKWRPVKIVVTICAVYFVCWAIPGIYGFVLTLNSGELPANYPTTMATLIMAPSLSAIINPCMYTLHREVKLKFLELMGCRKKHGTDFEASLGTETSISARILNMLPTYSPKIIRKKICCSKSTETISRAVSVQQKPSADVLSIHSNEYSDDDTNSAEVMIRGKTFFVTLEEINKKASIGSENLNNMEHNVTTTSEDLNVINDNNTTRSEDLYEIDNSTASGDLNEMCVSANTITASEGFKEEAVNSNIASKEIAPMSCNTNVLSKEFGDTATDETTSTAL